MKGDSVCAMCCLQCPPGRRGSRRSCTLPPGLLEKLSTSGFKNGDKSSEDKLARNLKKWACSMCLKGLKGVVDKREEVEGMEEQVRRVQEQILRMQREVIKLLRKLGKSVERFKMEVNQMQGILVVGREYELTECLREEEGGLVEEVVQFRSKIVEAFQILGGIQVPRKSSVLKCHRASTDDLLVDMPVKSECDPEWQDCLDEDASDNHWNPDAEDDDTSDLIPDARIFELDSTKTEATDKDIAENGGNKEASVPMARSVRKRQGKKKQFEETGSDSEDSNAEDDYEPETPTRKKFKPTLDTLNLQKMSAFKRKIIRRTLKNCETERQNREVENELEPGQFDDVNPLKLHSLIYDPTADTFNLAGYQLTVNEENSSIQCSTCGFQCKEQKGMRLNRMIYNHIFGFHLNLFQCPHCPSNLTDIHSFRNHVLGHRNAFPCDICGRPLKGSYTIQLHKWTHMNAEEKQEALQKGMKPPQNIRKPKDPDRYQCSTCGKRFSSRQNWNYHEKSHNEQPGQLCTTCGKTLKDLGYHQKFVCYPGKEAGVPKDALLRFECSLCLKRFPTVGNLNFHKVWRHSDARPYKCQMCDKAFKTKRSLKDHQKCHADVRSLVCRKGCGAAFKRYNGRCKHETRCGGASKWEPAQEYNQAE